MNTIFEIKNDKVSWWLIIAVFFFVYTISLPGLPASLHTTRIVGFIIAIVAFFSSKGKHKIASIFQNKSLKKLFLWNLWLIFYIGIIILSIGSGTGDNIITTCINFVIFVPLAYYGFSYFIKTPEQLFKILIYITVIQSIIIITALIVPAFRDFLIISFYVGQSYWGEDFYEIERFVENGYNLGLSCITSTGSMKMSLGMIGVTYFILSDSKKKLLYYLIFLLITFAAVSVARTSLVCAVACFLVICIYEIKKSSLDFIRLLLVVVICGFLFSNVISMFFISGNLEQIFKRLIQSTEDGYIRQWMSDGYIEGESTMVPPISVETIVGTGVTSGRSGNGIEVNVDGGYRRNYVAMGLITAIVNYIIIFGLYIKNARKSKNVVMKYMSILMLIIFAIGEFKEPFIYSMYFLVYSLVFFSFIDKEKYCFKIN